MKQEPARADARSPRLLARIASLLWSTVKAYFNDKVPRLGAALAFYTTIAVAPLLMLAVAVAKIFFKDESARQRIIGEIDQLVGGDASRAIASVQPAVPGDDATSIATWVGIGTLTTCSTTCCSTCGSTATCPPATTCARRGAC